MGIEDTIRALLRDELRFALADLRGIASPNRDELITYAQAAELVKVGVSTVKAWVRSGELPVYGAASTRRVKPAEVLAVFKRIDVKTTPAEEKPEDVDDILATLHPLRRAR